MGAPALASHRGQVKESCRAPEAASTIPAISESEAHLPPSYIPGPCWSQLFGLDSSEDHVAYVHPVESSLDQCGQLSTGHGDQHLSLVRWMKVERADDGRRIHDDRVQPVFNGIPDFGFAGGF